MDAVKIKLLRDILKILDQIYHALDKMAENYIKEKE